LASRDVRDPDVNGSQADPAIRDPTAGVVEITDGAEFVVQAADGHGYRVGDQIGLLIPDPLVPTGRAAAGS
jgi:hypothetical protein